MNQIEIAGHMELIAVQVRNDAIAAGKAIMAGTATAKFWDVMENAFGYEEDVVETHYAERQAARERAAAAEEEAADAQEMPTEAIVTKGDVEKGPTKPLKKRPLPAQPEATTKRPKGTFTDAIPLGDAEVFFPTMSGRYHYVGNPGIFISDRKKVPEKANQGCYACLFTERTSEVSKRYPRCHFISESRPQVATHIREFHLGVALGCWVCFNQQTEYRVYSGRAWKIHMDQFHGVEGREKLSFEDYFKPSGLDLRTICVVDEVTVDQFLSAVQEHAPTATVATTETSESVQVKIELPSGTSEPRQEETPLEETPAAEAIPDVSSTSGPPTTTE